MPDPSWTAQYDLSKTPEANGFARQSYGAPVVTATTAGPAAGRKVQVNTDAGDAVFTLNTVPAFDEANGATAEFTVAVTGSGDAGFELDFIGRAVMLNVYADRIYLELANDAWYPVRATVPTASNTAATTFRLTVDAGGAVRVYRNGVLTSGPHACPASARPARRYLWWAESTGVQTFTSMKFYTGGPVAP